MNSNTNGVRYVRSLNDFARRKMEEVDREYAQLDAAKPATISRKIVALVAGGADPIEAMKTVCGAEKVDTMIDDLYRQLAH